MFKKLGNVANIIGMIVKYLPVILLAFKALEEVKLKIEEISADNAKD